MPKTFAAAVLLVTPQGIPLVRDWARRRKKQQIFWKLPGGKGNPGETAQECALRELEEETGVVLEARDLRVISKQTTVDDHTFTMFEAQMPLLPDLKEQGDEDEEIGVFSPQHILAMQDFLPAHRMVVEEILRDFR